jgi:hypothetical protein
MACAASPYDELVMAVGLAITLSQRSNPANSSFGDRNGCALPPSLICIHGFKPCPGLGTRPGQSTAIEVDQREHASVGTGCRYAVWRSPRGRSRYKHRQTSRASPDSRCRRRRTAHLSALALPSRKITTRWPLLPPLLDVHSYDQRRTVRARCSPRPCW